MAEKDMSSQKDELYEEMKKDFLNQVKGNTEYFHKLKNIKDQEVLSQKFESPIGKGSKDLDNACKLVPSEKTLEELLQSLLDVNGKIAGILAERDRAPASNRFSEMSASSGVSSCRDSQLSNEPSTQGPDGQVVLPPDSQDLMERQGAASQTPRRGVGGRTRQAVESEDMTEVKHDNTSSSSED